ncbi:TonB-dependent receptor [Kangiella sediminilitoris]|uniref:TonB-dependent receptor n=1 Tax=Kangiella sediminilitoris TaxID=1144748 RepID=A0A1B3BDI8_9GAMM|nr:TonB-dependent receptor [Kangiella sediminilitoris]AOE50899.1 TonB-dependent receptor [Kangiella sediminilitoris]
MKPTKLSLLVLSVLATNSALAAEKNLTGIITDDNDQPMAGIEVNVRALNLTATTNESGRFVFDNLEEGRYVLDIEAGPDGHINRSIQHDGSEHSIEITPDNAEVMVITGNPLEHSSLEMASPSVIISGEELIKNRGANIGETLAQTPGINLSSFGSGAGRPVIRGQQGNRVTVLSNNTSTQDASNSSPDHWIAAEPLLADRVEVLKGPATLLYGGGAVGGAVNVVDHRIPKHLTDGIEGGFEARIADATTGERTTVGTVTTSSGNFAFNLDAFKSKTDDYEIPGYAESSYLREQEEAEHAGETAEEHAEHEEEFGGTLNNTNTDTKGGSFGLSYIGDDGYIGASYTEYDRSYGLPGHAHEEPIHEGETPEEHAEHAEEESVMIDVKQKRYDLKGQLDDPFAGFQNLKFSYAKTDYEHMEVEGEAISTQFTNDAQELRVEAVHKAWHGWQGAFGLQLSDSDFAAIGAETFIPGSNTKNYGLFWLEEVDKGDWHTELGLRVDKQEIDVASDGAFAGAKRNDNAFSFAAGTVWHIDDNWSLPINAAYAQRLPSVEELYSNAGKDESTYVPHLATLTIEVGNPELDEETANNLDLGLRYHTDDIHASISLFHNQVSDYIYLEHAEHEADGHDGVHEDLPILEYTQNDATFTGLEAEIDWTFGYQGDKYWKAGLFADYTRATLDQGGYLPRTPAKRFGGNFGFVDGGFSADFSAIKVTDQTQLAEDELPTDGYTLINMNFGYSIFFDNSDLLLFLKGENMANEEIRDHASFLKDRTTRAGRTLSAGFRLTF